ncbi:MAG: hypothetical protein ACYCP0_05825 [Acidiferrobacteraceae bacterium]
MTKRSEPSRLRIGKQFHARIQAEWKSTAQGVIAVEASITKPGGRKGRVDVLVDRGTPLAAVVEIKASNWDAMTEAAVRRNVQRFANQVHKYVESQLAEGSEVSPGIIFLKRPVFSGRLALIESLFDAHAISVVWQDEDLEECRARRSGDQGMGNTIKELFLGGSGIVWRGPAGQ